MYRLQFLLRLIRRHLRHLLCQLWSLGRLWFNWLRRWRLFFASLRLGELNRLGSDNLNALDWLLIDIFSCDLFGPLVLILLLLVFLLALLLRLLSICGFMLGELLLDLQRFWFLDFLHTVRSIDEVGELKYLLYRFRLNFHNAALLGCA